MARLVPRLLFCHLWCKIASDKYGWLTTDVLKMCFVSVKFPRNLKIAHFTQHHVDQLVMDTTSLELIQSKFPGEGNHPCNIA